MLIVEDSDDTRDVLQELFVMEGLQVLVADSVVDAREVAERQEIDILVADLRLPDGDGVEVAADLERRNPSLCTLFLSGTTPPPLAAGQRFLRKPARAAAILREVHGMLAARQSA
ncbi:MAG TPA: response regulator [Kofleriaceae bacterium]|nr:response regulator [Kofleriaceae bacterium]